MTATENDSKKCVCGRTMENNGRGAMYCENCDYVQPQQAGGFARQRTTEDIRFEMYWLQQEEKYEDNTNKDVGNPNSPNEGGTTND